MAAPIQTITIANAPNSEWKQTKETAAFN